MNTTAIPTAEALPQQRRSVLGRPIPLSSIALLLCSFTLAHPQPPSQQDSQAQSPSPAAQLTATAPPVQPRIEPLPPPPATPASTRRTAHTTLHLDAAADWTPTGIEALPGDTLTFTATGTLTFSDGHTATPEGLPRGWRDMLRSFPVDTAPAAALIGRIGITDAAVPFLIGTATTQTATQSGPIYVRANVSTQAPATGSFTLRIQSTPSSTNTATAAPPTPAELQASSLTALDTLPRRVTDAAGTPGDALNFALIGTEDDLRSAFTRSGWVAVDPDPNTAILHGLLNTLQHKPYVELPMSTLYLFQRPQDLAFARASAIRVVTERHHLRCWKTELKIDGRPLWIGAATHDTGLESDDRNGNLTHRIAPEIDEERDFLRDTFRSSGSFQTGAYLTPSTPVREAHTATGGSFRTDGRLLVLALRPSTVKATTTP